MNRSIKCAIDLAFSILDLFVNLEFNERNRDFVNRTVDGFVEPMNGARDVYDQRYCINVRIRNSLMIEQRMTGLVTSLFLHPAIVEHWQIVASRLFQPTFLEGRHNSWDSSYHR
jgi:hypothetical protein